MLTWTGRVLSLLKCNQFVKGAALALSTGRLHSSFKSLQNLCEVFTRQNRLAALQ